MEVLTDLNNIDIDRSVVCVGTFDGLHQGHLVVINKTIAHAQRLKAKSIVFTFWPHPHEVIFPDKNIYYLNTYQEKIDLFAKSGIDYLVLYPFSKNFANKTSKEFIHNFLIQQLKMIFFVIGYDHQFGRQREGTYENLKKCAKDTGFGIERVKQESIADELVSSTKIRNLIKDGNLELSNRLLGYTYFTSGKVINGMKIGRTMNFPTANIKIESNKLMPKTGVYCVEALVENKRLKAMANIGIKPTINKDKELSLEVHIFNFDENIYQQSIKIYFYKRIRSEKKFESIEQLKRQLEQDQQYTLEYFKNV